MELEASKNLEEELQKLHTIEAEMQQQTRARNGIPLEGEALPPYNRSRALELKAMHTAQSEVVTRTMLSDGNRKVNQSVGGSAYAEYEDRRQR
ncbi:MAG TPA: hypothetical protein PKD15_00825 [Candidatus Saccharibacteria bacterium]|nr:hypothetical protein [Candidatus Saccharibacteria bacterium]